MNRKFSHLFFNIRGMTLVEMIIAIGISGFVVVVAGSVILDTLKAQNTLKYHTSRHTLRASLDKYFMSGENCRCSLAALDLNQKGPAGSYALLKPAGFSIKSDPEDCGSADQTILVSTGADYDRLKVKEIRAQVSDKLADGQFLALVSLDIEADSQIYRDQKSPQQDTENFLIMLQTTLATDEATGISEYVLDGCGKNTSGSATGTSGSASLRLKKGLQAYKFPGVNGDKIGLVKIDFRWGENFEFVIFDDKGNVIDVHYAATGVTGHIRHSTTLALVPLVGGQFRARLRCFGKCTKGKEPSMITLLSVEDP